MGFNFFKFGLVASLALAANVQAIKVACVGNSITEGYGLNWNDKKYPDHLQEMLGENYQVQNFGNSGKMFHKKSDESYWKQTTFASAYDFAPDIVVIELGTNDSKYFHDGKGSEGGFNYYNYEGKGYTLEGLADELQKDYEALIDTFAHQPQAPVIYATLQPYAENFNWFITDTAIVNQINPIIKKAAESKGVKLIDLHAKFNKPEWLLDDNVHPNAVGAEELAKIIAGAIVDSEAPDSPTSSFDADVQSSSSMEQPQSSSEPTAIKNDIYTNTRIFTQKNVIKIDHFVGNVSVFDLNGNLVKQAYAKGSVFFQMNRAGTYIIKAGNRVTTAKIMN